MFIAVSYMATLTDYLFVYSRSPVDKLEFLKVNDLVDSNAEMEIVTSPTG